AAYLAADSSVLPSLRRWAAIHSSGISMGPVGMAVANVGMSAATLSGTPDCEAAASAATPNSATSTVAGPRRRRVRGRFMQLSLSTCGTGRRSGPLVRKLDTGSENVTKQL